MLFIRINDNAEIAGENEIINFTKEKRKGNIVKKFILNKKHEDTDDALEYFYEELITKMIPKKSMSLLENHPIKILTTSNENIIVFQDLDCKISFLTIDNFSGKIVPINFDDIIAQEDSILCYDGEDWYLDDVDSTFIFYYDGEFDDCELEDIESELEADEFENMDLSNYIINSENGGIIINNIYIL
jgi:hypothetical protein